MANKSMAYDHPTYTARHIVPIRLPATAASTSVAKFPVFTDVKIKSIAIRAGVVGTADAAGYDLLNGTTSFGQVVMGTVTGMGTVTFTEQTLASDGYLDIKTKAASATMAADAVVEFEIIPGANVTV